MVRDLMARIGRAVGLTPRVDDLTDEETKTVIRNRLEAQQARLRALDAQVDAGRPVMSKPQHQ